jgi:hypothetical protein
MKRRGDAARYRAESPDADELIGKFNATQRRERVLVSNNYSHYVVVFRSTIMLIETDHKRDRIAAVAKFASVALPFGNWLASLANAQVVTQVVRWIQDADSGLVAGAASLPKSRAVEDTLAAKEHLTPDLVERSFRAGLVSELPTACITSAVLNRGPAERPEGSVAPAVLNGAVTAAAQVPLPLMSVAPALINVGPLSAELIIKYRNPQRKEGLELWLGANGAEPLDDVATMMREALGTDRFSEQADYWYAWRGVLPGRAATIDWSRPPGR